MESPAPSIADRVRRLLVDELELAVPPAEILLDDALYAPHIQLDSLGYVRLVVALELAFDIDLTEAGRGRVVFETVGDIVAHIAARLAG